jgi:hypothetical protein
MTTQYAFNDDSGLTRFEGVLVPDPAAAASPNFTGTTTVVNLTVTGNAAIGNAGADTLGFYGATPVAQQAAPVTLGDVIAALQALGLVAT